MLLILGIWGCENDRQYYDGEPNDISGIYFQYFSRTLNGERVWQDSLLFSFQNILPEIKEYTVSIPVKLLGFVSQSPRTFQVKVCGGTAIEGEDFIPLEKEYIFPAEVSETTFPLILKRTDKLFNNKISIELELLENEDFRLLMPEITSLGDTLDATRFKVVYSEIITKPFFWLSAQRFLGNFSVKKINFLDEIMGWTIQDWQKAGQEGALITYGKFNYAATLMRNKLQALADDGKPVYDEDGSFMQLGSGYKVDYSRYQTDAL